MDQDDNDAPKLHLALEPEKTAPPSAGKAALPILAMLAVAILSGILLTTRHPESTIGQDATHASSAPLAADNLAASATPPAPAPALSGTQKVDVVDTAARAAIDGRFAAYTAKLAPLKLNEPKARAAFLAAPQLEPAVKAELLAAVDRGTRKVAEITLWDNFDEDGDIVSITSAGVTQVVPLLHAPTRVYIPYEPGTSFVITGTHDGTGGITAAIETGAGAVPLPILSVGQTIVLPLL